jgi:glucan phosphorylase
MAAYKQGVFNYIKEDTDRLTQEPVAKKYFSGGIIGRKIARKPAGRSAFDFAEDNNARVSVELQASAPAPKVLYNGTWQQVSNRELKKYLHNLQNPGTNKVVSDVSLEAFIDFFLGKGGLGFLAYETWRAYSDLDHWKAMGVMPLYSFDKDGNKIDWDNKAGFQPVFIQDEAGRKSTLSLDVDFKGKKERVYIYWYNANGTPVFLIKHASLFRRLYPSGDEQTMQYGFLGRAYVELMKAFAVSPDILRLSESQLLFVATAMRNDVEYYRNKGEKSILDGTKVVMTTHTPELAALPSWYDVAALKGLVGGDLVRDDIVFAGKVNAAGALGTYSDMVNGVSPEHKDITIEAVLPHIADKTTGIQNGSAPDLWRSQALNDLVTEKKIANVTGKELFDIGMAQKRKLNVYLKENGFDEFKDIERPMWSYYRMLWFKMKRG